MRYFPRDAFKNLAVEPDQVPNFQFQPMQLFPMQEGQYQLPQQIGIPNLMMQASITDPTFLFRLQMLLYQQSIQTDLLLQSAPTPIFSQFTYPPLNLTGFGCFGFPGFFYQ
jgi:hypothetical protein